MINKILLFALLFSTDVVGQPLYFSFPFSISDNMTGNTHPRVTLVNDEPLLVWGETTDFNLFYSKWNGSGFTSPNQLTYTGEDIMLGYAEGPVLKSKGDSVYVVYVSMGPNEHRVYLRRSFDGGQSFSDTILVNDRANGVSLEYANFELDENGNPAVNFIRNEIGDVPKYAFYRSFDGGTTFSPEINATPDTNSQPCECCPASILLENNRVYLTYRNNVSNIRDFYVSVSENGGISFDSLKRVDFSNYFSSSCPASGSSSIISGDSVLGVFMTKISGQSLIRAGSMHKTTLSVGTEYFVDPTFPAGGYNMNYPEIAGRGDTIGIVWQDNRSGSNKCYISTSTTGLKGLSAPQLVSDFTPALSVNPHVIYKNGYFHITWRDITNGNIWYRKASFDAGILAVQENNPADFTVYPQPANESLIIGSSGNTSFNYRISDINGKMIFSGQSGNRITQLNTSGLIPGVYFLSISSEKNVSVKKILIQR